MLEGSRHPTVRIRPVESSDGSLIEEYASDPRIAATSHVPFPYPRGAGAVFVAKAMDGWKHGVERTFAVVSDDRFAGVVSLMAIDRPLGRAQVGYWIAVPYWGKGIATEAVRLVVDLAYAVFGLRSLGAACLADNDASARVLEKAGFAEGRSLTYKGPDRRFEGRAVRTFTLQLVDGVQGQPPAGPGEKRSD